MKFEFDFLKDRYDYELQRREQLTAALTLPVGVLTILGGAMAAMARQETQTPTRPAPQPTPQPPQFPPNREIRDGDRPREHR